MLVGLFVLFSERSRSWSPTHVDPFSELSALIVALLHVHTITLSRFRSRWRTATLKQRIFLRTRTIFQLRTFVACQSPRLQSVKRTECAAGPFSSDRELH